MKENSTPIKRGKLVSKLKDISHQKNIPIKEFVGKAVYPKSIKLRPIHLLYEAASLRRPNNENLDMIWMANWITRPLFPKPCNWSGFMQEAFSTTPSSGKSSIIMLPLIDLQPSDPTCIYSTLLFIKEQASNMNIKTPCVTFDQPLWAKATSIIAEKNLDIVFRLGGFHLLLSF